MNDLPANISVKSQKVNYVFGYVRGSTSKQEITIQNQQERIKQYFDNNSHPGGEFHGCEFGGFFSDEGVSGKVPWFERPAGEVLFRQLRRGDHIVIFKLSRAGRGNVDLLNSVEKLQAAGVALHSLHEKIDMTTAVGRFFVSILAAFAQMERETLSENTKEALRWKARQGLPHNTNTPIGWVKRGLKHESRFEPNDAERRWCLWVYDQFMAGRTIYDICNDLKQRGVILGQSHCNRGPKDIKFYKPSLRARALLGATTVPTVQSACMAARMFIESGCKKWPKITNKRYLAHWKHFLKGGSGHEVECDYIPNELMVHASRTS